MVNVKEKWCILPGCTKRPSYGAAGIAKREFCSQHKEEGMVDLNSKICGHGGCTKRSSFGVASSTKKEFCAQHKKEGMVNLVRDASKIQSSEGGRSGVGVFGLGSSATADPDGIALPATTGKRRRACSPSPTQVEASSDSRRRGDKITRRAPTVLRAASTSVEPARDESSSEPGNAAKVKMETGLFEGRPCGSSQSQRHRGRHARTAPASGHS